MLFSVQGQAIEHRERSHLALQPLAHQLKVAETFGLAQEGVQKNFQNSFQGEKLSFICIPAKAHVVKLKDCFLISRKARSAPSNVIVGV